jgi:hypothetical protein
MDVSSVVSGNGLQYNASSVSEKKDKEKLANVPNNKDLGVIVEISKESEQALTMSGMVNERVRGEGLTAYKTISSGLADGMVSFYGASITKEQSEKLQDVIRDLEQQGFVSATPNENGDYQAGDETLGASWEPGTYAQLGLKVSQLSYACKEIGLSGEAASQITSTYGKQMEEKINKVNSLVDAVAKQMEVEKEKLYKMVEEKGDNPYKTKTRASNTTGKSSVELNQEANLDIYNMFSTLDISSKESFQSSFQNALESFRSYWSDDPIETYTGTERERIQLEALVTRFNEYLNV